MPDRPTLIMLPAMPCGADFYAEQVSALEDLVDPMLMVLDRPSMAENAAAVLATAPPRFFIAGTAYGGLLAIEVAATAPERTAGLWLMNCNPGAHSDPEEAWRINARVRAGGFEDVIAEWAQIIVASDDSSSRRRFLSMARAGGPERFCNQHEASICRSDRWMDLRSIATPTLIVWGEDDLFVPLAIGRRMAEAIPAARFVTLPGCRHFPPLERPKETIVAARSWLTAALVSSQPDP
jgi:pimeloyl-ACP methyl ester carboxylesterase